MTSALDDIKAGLQEWLKDATGIPGSRVIFAHQNKTPPTGGFFIVINPLISSSKKGLYDEQIQLSSGATQVRGYRDGQASIQAFGAGAYDALLTAVDKLDIESLYAGWFEARYLTVSLMGQVRNLTGLKGNRYEERAQMDISIQYAALNTDTTSPYEDDPGYFDTLEYSVSPVVNGHDIPTSTVTGA